MAALSAALLLPSPSLSPSPLPRRTILGRSSLTFRPSTQLRRPSFRSPNFSQERSGLGEDSRIWSRTINPVYGDEDEDDTDEEEDRSLDLLARFVQNVFRKISKKARRAVRSVLPQSIPTELVGFSVNGVLVLAFLWVLKAFLEVVCTLGSVVFVSILLLRGVWTGLTYLQEVRYHKLNGTNDDPRAWTNSQPVT